MDEKVPQDTQIAQESHHEDTSSEKLNAANDPHAQAIKGDESDGKVNWTIRSALTAFCLCMVYTGKHKK